MKRGQNAPKQKYIKRLKSLKKGRVDLHDDIEYENYNDSVFAAILLSNP